MTDAPRMFPLQSATGLVMPGPTAIPWEIAEKAYAVYAKRYGRQQSLERLAERGGFDPGEMDNLYPPWRDEIDVLVKLRAALKKYGAHLLECRSRYVWLSQDGTNVIRDACTCGLSDVLQLLIPA